MAFAGSTLMCGPLPPRVGQNHSPVTNRAPPLKLQVTRKEGQKLLAQKALSVSRRDMLTLLTAGTMSGIIFSPIEPAEARTRNAETRRKIFEKLEQLREKAGISKPRTKDSEKNTSLQPPSGKEENLQISLPSLVEAAMEIK